jgi:hypothetical protein
VRSHTLFKTFANMLLTSCSVKCFKVHIPTHDEDDAGKSDGTQDTHGERPSTGGIKPDPSTEQDLVKPVLDVVPLQSGQDDQDAGAHSPSQVHPFEAVHRDPRFKPLFRKYPSLRSKLQKIYEITWEPTRFGIANPAEVAEGKTPRYVSPHMKGQWNQEKADRIALKSLDQMAAKDEALREFIVLCSLVLEPQAAQVGSPT